MMINKKSLFNFKIISELTEVLPSPDVHVGVVLAQVVEPTLVHDEDPTSDDRSPAEERGVIYILYTHCSAPTAEWTAFTR